MSELEIGRSPFVAALARQRHRLLVEAAPLLDPDRAVGEDAAVRRLAGLLAASLEQLKAAEEELLQQQGAVADALSAPERELQHFRQLFARAPIALVVTDMLGTIRQANDAAVSLLRRAARLLDRKPLPSLLPRDKRAAFRDAIARLSLTAAAANWGFVIERPTDTPIAVIASAQVALDVRGKQEWVIWALRPAEPTEGAVAAGGRQR